MDRERIRALLETLREGQITTENALEHLSRLPYEDLGFAMLDHHRALRQGFPEVVFCQGKTVEQVSAIFKRLAAENDVVLATRATPQAFAAVRDIEPAARYHDVARVITLERTERTRTEGVAVVSAGTSDIPVAEEAAITAEGQSLTP